MAKGGRGVLTQEIKEVSSKMLGYEINVTELRLMPYLQSLSINCGRIDISRINSEERDILSNRKEKGRVQGGASSEIIMSKNFRDAVCEILYLGYMNGE